MPEAFTLRMFVPDGDPEGVRFIDRMNWTGLGLCSRDPSGLKSGTGRSSVERAFIS